MGKWDEGPPPWNFRVECIKKKIEIKKLDHQILVPLGLTLGKDKNFLGPKIFWEAKCFWTQNFWAWNFLNPKILRTKIFFRPKIFGEQKGLRT